MDHININQPRALTEIQAAGYIGMSRSFLRQSRMDGPRSGRTKAPRFIKNGRKVLYLIEELNLFLDQFQKLDHLGQLNKAAP